MLDGFHQKSPASFGCELKATGGFSVDDLVHKIFRCAVDLIHNIFHQANILARPGIAVKYSMGR